MIQRRWVLWAGLLGGVIALRWWDPLARPSPSAVELAQPMSKATRARPLNAAPISTQSQTPNPDTTALITRPPQTAAQGNLFALRTPSPEPPPSEPPPEPEPEQPPEPPPEPETPPSPPAPAPPPAPPLQVIGTYLHAGNLSVFLAGPTGTLQAKVGETVMGEYRVDAIQGAQITLTHLATQHSLVLPIPGGNRSPVLPP